MSGTAGGRSGPGRGDPREPASEVLHPCAVRVPGSTSNLGAGFDCIGLAIDRELSATFEPGGNGLILRRAGTLGELAGTDGEDLLLTAFRQALNRAGRPRVRGVVEVHSSIPVGKGLGSSAAALVAGTALAGAARGRPVDAEAAFRAALDVEGHGDNAAPAAFGGLRAVVGRGPAVRVLELDLSPRVDFAFAAPPVVVSTKAAREALPRSVPFHQVAAGVGRAVALLRGLATGDGELLAQGFDDALHAPHRMALVPGADEAADGARAAGAWGVTVSGAGSGLLAVGPAGSGPGLARALAEGLARVHDPAAVIFFPLRPVTEGVRAGSIEGGGRSDGDDGTDRSLSSRR